MGNKFNVASWMNDRKKERGGGGGEAKLSSRSNEPLYPESLTAAHRSISKDGSHAHPSRGTRERDMHVVMMHLIPYHLRYPRMQPTESGALSLFLSQSSSIRTGTAQQPTGEHPSPVPSALPPLARRPGRLPLFGPPPPGPILRRSTQQHGEGALSRIKKSEQKCL